MDPNGLNACPENSHEVRCKLTFSTNAIAERFHFCKFLTLFSSDDIC